MTYAKGAKVETAEERRIRKGAHELLRKILPGFRVPDPKDETAKRAAYQLAKENLHKPWARRYMQQLRHL